MERPGIRAETICRAVAPNAEVAKTKLAGLGIIGTLGSLFLMFVMSGQPGNHNNASTTTSTESSAPPISDGPSSSQLHSPAEGGTGQVPALQPASEGTAGEQQDLISSAASTEQAGSAAIIAAKIQDNVSVNRNRQASMPNITGSEVTFMHH